MTKHLVSIIIPVYNVSDYVEECLQSVAAQTYTDIECIIVDDCGTDDSMQKVEQFVTSYQGPIAFKILHHEHNRGLSAARNTGMDAATGEYIYFIDSDDYIYPYSIDVLVKAIEQQPDIDIAYANYNGKKIMSSQFGVEEGIYDNSLLFRSQGKLLIMAWNQLYKRAFLSNHSLYFAEGLIHEDDVWSFQVACHMPKIVILNKITYYFRERKGSISTLSFTSRAPNYCKVYEEMTNFVFSHHLKHNIDAFHCINADLKRYYMFFLWNGNRNITNTFYLTIRESPYWNFFQIWSFTHSWKYILMHLHRYMPKRTGFKYFQYIYAKCFDK